VLLYDQERAMQVARRLRESGEIFEAELLFAPQFNVVREHPDFPHLLDDLGLTDHWNSIGCEWRDDRVRCEESQI
jgi:hypothetical protein